MADSKYVIINTETEDFLVSNIKGTYKVGDIIQITYEEDKIEDISPRPIKAIDEELVKASLLEEEPTDDLDNNNNNNVGSSGESEEPNNTPSTNENSNKPETNNNPTETVKPNTSQSNQNGNSNNGNSNNNNSTTQESADTAVLNYFNDYQTKINSGTITDTLKSGFVTVVDFLFYNGKIAGHTFSELTNTVKLKVLSMALYFDGKIEKYFPGYKESISNTASKIYTNVKSKVVSAYLTITTTICTNNADLCASAKEGFGELKKNFGLTWELIKDIAGDGLSNLKKWYEIWRES